MISALILAAGQSKRMGQPKMLLPWGDVTVLGAVIDTLRTGNIENILVVTGGHRAEVEHIAARHAASAIHNPDYAKGEMLSSIQCGVRSLASSNSPHPKEADTTHERDGVLICLGDQPQIQLNSVKLVCKEFQRSQAGLVVPSFQNRRGHPWLAAYRLWDSLLALDSSRTPRDFLNTHAAQIHYVEVDNPSVLADLDTFEEYLKSRP